ncbi:unnamed protein product (mitochondrion) [Plasmodiophora brassicae]|uniref:Calponin-homology (CH) domain-containing protein n=1 Tax=Plasmodiophora brassicae TaxID=37360 RepID=A0A3P3Y5A5_PLABS|nr:unnamed protein product [Plasmodiophora brassicae]
MGEGVAACAVDVGAAEAPPPETDAIMDAAGACLRLEGFAPPTFVEFGRVRVGTSSRKSLTIVNPGRSALSVVIDPIADPAFQLDRTVLDVAECGGRADVFITWSPTEGNPDGKNVRVSLSLRSNSRQKFKVVLTGASVRGSHDPRRGTRPRRKWNSTKAKPSRNNFVDENVDDNSVVATEPVMSTGKGVAWTADLEAPLQLAYDEQWMEKQTTGFVAWVNFVFKQREFPESFISERETNTTFTTAAERRAHAHLLQRAFYFYRSHPVQTIISRLEKAVSEGQLRIRDDIQMLNDLGLRDRFVGILSSYHNAWLRLALETVYGEFLAKSLCLRHFIQTRLLSNAEIDREHAYMYTPQGQPFFTEAHQPAMRSFVLKKFLQLVLFLDMAKTQNVFPVSPRLFNTTGTIKSTKAVLFEFSAVFMAGMGDFARAIFLSCGYECAASQSPLDEFDFSVKDLGNDFRDGVRLCALADRPEIFKKVLLPAVNTTRKKHNVGLAMQAFFDQGISLNSCPADEIVSGNREHTLDLLWRVAIQLRIPALVDAATLFWESRLIERDLTKDRLFAKANLGSPPIMYPNCPQLQCILRWCMAICAHYDVPIFNFTSSFADGRAFAFLIHYYYPQLVRREDIRGARPAHDDTVLGESADRLSNDMPWADFIDVSLPFEGSSELGCIPMLVPIPGSNSFRSAPDEKVVVIFLSYLSARLVTLSQEAHAARKIQKAWRALRISRMTSRFYGSAVVVQAGLHTVLLGRIQAARHIIMAALKSYSLSVGARARCIATVTLGAVLANCRPCRDIQKHMAVRTLQASLLSSSFAAHVKRCFAVVFDSVCSSPCSRSYNFAEAWLAAVHETWRAARLLQLRKQVSARSVVRVMVTFAQARSLRKLNASLVLQSSLRALSTAGLNAWLVPNWCQKRLAFRRSSAIALIGQRCVRAVQLRRRVSSGLSIAQAALSTFIAMNNARLALASLICIQSAMRTAAAVQGFSTTVRAIVRVQSRWRGLRERRRATAKVAAARQRIEDAASRWTIELTVGYRTRAALDILLSGSKLSAVMHACRTLEVTTRTLAGCADDTVQNDAVPVLYALMQSLNRSKPHLELLQCALNILVNLSNNASTTAAVYQADACVDVMLELLQTQRDNGELFTKATQLLSRGCCSTAPGFARRLQSGSKRLSSIHGILSRKLEMQVRYQPSSRVAAKQTAALRRSVESIEELLRLVNDPPRE